MLAVLLASPLPALASTDGGAESDLVQRINAERRSRGLPGLQPDGELQAVARRQAQRMADRGEMFHNPNLRGEVCCWRKVGENVGTGSDSAAIHRMMMDSSSHRSNILDPRYTQVGVGVERRGDTIWVSQVFRHPDGVQAPPAEPEPQPEPEPPPAPPTHARSQPQPDRQPEQANAPAPEEETPPPDPPRPTRRCEDATSVALARALSTHTGQRIGEVLATMCPTGFVRTVGLQR